MKKVFSLLLALCLLVSTSALAADNTLTTANQSGTTEVTYVVAAGSYTVTIPATVALDSAGTGSMTIALDATNYNVKEMLITVTLKIAKNYSSGFYLSDGTNKIAYTLRNGTTDIVPDSSTTPIIKWNTANTTKTASTTLNIAANNTGALAGSYSDTLTFSVSATSDSNQTPTVGF